MTHAHLRPLRLARRLHPDAEGARRHSRQDRRTGRRTQDPARGAAECAPGARHAALHAARSSSPAISPRTRRPALAGGENPKHPDEEKSFDELKARIAKVLAFVDGVDDAAFEAGLARDVTFPRGPSATVTMRGENYLTLFRRAELLFPRHHRLRDPARERHPDRQAGFSARRLLDS